MKPHLLILLPAGLMALTACSGSTDPRTANIFDNIANLQSGEYDRQIAAREAEAQAIINANNATQGRINSLEAQRASNASAIASLRSQISAVRAEIARAKASNPAAAPRLDQLGSQLNAVQRDVSNGADASIASAELARIRSAVRSLSA